MLAAILFMWSDFFSWLQAYFLYSRLMLVVSCQNINSFHVKKARNNGCFSSFGKCWTHNTGMPDEADITKMQYVPSILTLTGLMHSLAGAFKVNVLFGNSIGKEHHLVP